MKRLPFTIISSHNSPGSQLSWGIVWNPQWAPHSICSGPVLLEESRSSTCLQSKIVSGFLEFQGQVDLGGGTLEQQTRFVWKFETRKVFPWSFYFYSQSHIISTIALDSLESCPWESFTTISAKHKAKPISTQQIVSLVAAWARAVILSHYFTKYSSYQVRRQCQV